MTWKEEKRMKYRVTIRYIDVTFDDRMEALDFADQAKMHADEDTPVTIELIDEKEAKA